MDMPSPLLDEYMRTNPDPLMQLTKEHKGEMLGAKMLEALCARLRTHGK